MSFSPQERSECCHTHSTVCKDCGETQELWGRTQNSKELKIHWGDKIYMHKITREVGQSGLSHGIKKKDTKSLHYCSSGQGVNSWLCCWLCLPINLWEITSHFQEYLNVKLEISNCIFSNPMVVSTSWGKSWWVPGGWPAQNSGSLNLWEFSSLSLFPYGMSSSISVALATVYLSASNPSPSPDRRAPKYPYLPTTHLHCHFCSSCK